MTNIDGDSIQKVITGLSELKLSTLGMKRALEEIAIFLDKEKLWHVLREAEVKMLKESINE